MESQGSKRSPHKQTNTHHHHHQHCLHCPLRRHCHHCPLHNPHFHANHFLTPQTQPFLAPLPHFATLPLQTHRNSEPFHYHQEPIFSHALISQELEHTELDGEEEDDEPIFVLTDEWREFFAKSEAKRKLEKKQGKKGKK